MSRKWLLIFVLAAFALLVDVGGWAAGETFSHAASAPVGTAFTYQGSLSSGDVPLDGTCDFRFGLWDALDDGTQVGDTQELTGVTVSGGYFTAQLDFGRVFDGTALWLEIAVRCGGETDFNVLLPRQALTATPSAVYSQQAPWSGVTGIPAGFADGLDDDTTYSAGTGLVLEGTTINVVFSGTGSAATVSRSDHDHDARYYTEAELQGDGTATVHWNNLSYIPDGLGDGDDDTLAGLLCAHGEYVIWDEPSGQWACAGDGGYGRSEYNPAASCADLLQAEPSADSGVYWLEPPSAPSAFRAYCDMLTEGGGWTLVWSNLRGFHGKVVREMQWGAAINTLPRVQGEVSADLESFIIYTGLKHWSELAPGAQLRYDWANDYGRALDQSYACTFSLDPVIDYTISLSDCWQLIGSTVPSFVSIMNNMPFSTYDADHDPYGGNCADMFGRTPWWYADCWAGSIHGYGEEFYADGAGNGAYWAGTSQSWGSDDGQGAGNGWMFVR